MRFKHLFKKTAAEKTLNDVEKKEYQKNGKGPGVPEGLLKRCNACKSAVFVEEVKENHYICPHCNNYFRMDAYKRIELIADEGSFTEWDRGFVTKNPLNFKGYEEKIKTLQEKTDLDEAVVTGQMKIFGKPAVVGVCDGRFLMASMGEVVGEKITCAIERATKQRLPIILFACSGGARMQEGMISLMQMAKTSAALKRHSNAGLLYISVLTDPTTGGVTASFAMLGDIILAEPNALIGFAGRRVIEQTIGQKLPKEFQRSEFLLEHGFVDCIVEREKLKNILGNILHLHQKADAEETTEKTWRLELEKMMGKPEQTTGRSCRMSAWENVQLARDKERPTGMDYIKLLFQDFVEMHGDRCFKDDAAVVGGIARFCGYPVTVLVQEKGSGTKENIAHNFGMVSPEGYRKSLRLMKQAEKFKRPVICFVDTPGAFCGVEAEERGQGEAIARNLYEMSDLKVPILSIVIGEGGSGGALAFAVADEVWMMEHAVYSILSPEGFASILWKDSKRAKEAAEVMKLTSWDLKKAGIIENVIVERKPLTRKNLDRISDKLKGQIARFIYNYTGMREEELIEHRYKKFRKANLAMKE